MSRLISRIFAPDNSTKFLILILVISAFFRFYNFQNFQYWSGDEEIASAVVRKMIIGKQITLISPNSNLGLSLGSFFHIASVPLFLIAKMNPITVLGLIPLLGIATTYVIYLAGKTLGGTKLGLTSAFLYSSSFLVTLFDKRWWPLTLNCFLTSLSLLALLKIVKEKKFYYSIFLAIAIGFAGHADPSLAVIAISSLIIFLIFKINFFRKEFIPAIVVLLIFIAPLIVFEAKHPGSIAAPLLKSFLNVAPARLAPNTININVFRVASSTFTRLLFTKPSGFAESQLCSCSTYEPPLFADFSTTIILFLLIFPILLIIKNKNYKSLYIIPYIFLLVFFISTEEFQTAFNLPIHQAYFTIIFPVILLLISYSLIKIFKNNFALPFVLLLILSINLYTIFNSSFKYPLFQKEKLVQDLSKEIGSSNFSFYAVGDAWFHGGGYTGLFILNNKHPKKSYIYYFYDWMYKAHSLYTVTPTEQDQEKIVVIGPVGKIPNTNLNTLYSETVGNIEGKIFDNSTFSFDPKTLSVL
jgi:4-amino-4-deoxy-L-arabinose transferase-like glycosyltransferase